MTAEKKPRNPYLLPIFLIVAVDVLGLTIVLPLLPFYAEKFGASPLVVGLLVTSFAVCQLVSGPVLGRLSDHFGRRPLLIVSQIGTFIGFLVLAFAQSLPIVFLARVIDGVTAGNISLAQAYISDVTEPHERAKSFALIGIAFGLGFLIGPGVSGYLSQFDYRYPILAAAALSFTSIVATATILPRNTHTRPNAEARRSVLDWGSYLAYFRRPELRGLLLQFSCFYFQFALFIGGFALFAERRFTFQGHPFQAREVGYIFAYSGFLGIFLQGGLIGRLVKKFGERKLVVAGFVSTVVGYLGLGFAGSIGALVLVTTISSFGTGVLRPCIMSQISQRAGKTEQGTVLGLTQSLNSVAQILAPMAAGLLIEHGMLLYWALLAAAAALGGFVLSAVAL